MFKVGLTGGIGSGKSMVAATLTSLGVTVIDTDQVARDLTGPGGLAMPAIRETFGDQVVQADGALNRAVMREHVFSDPDARHRLEAILHPMIRQEVGRLAAAASGQYLVFEVPLLVESGRWHDQVDRICVVDCEPETQIARVMTRSALTRDQVERILQAQATRQQRLALADDIIANENATSAEQLRQQVLVLHQRWCNLAAC
jgi:dephospho-CoA kinase